MPATSARLRELVGARSPRRPLDLKNPAWAHGARDAERRGRTGPTGPGPERPSRAAGRDNPAAARRARGAEIGRPAGRPEKATGKMCTKICSTEVSAESKKMVGAGVLARMGLTGLKNIDRMSRASGIRLFARLTRWRVYAGAAGPNTAGVKRREECGSAREGQHNTGGTINCTDAHAASIAPAPG